MMIYFKLILLILITWFDFARSGRQCVTVKGRFMCNNEVPIYMQLIDRDTVTKNDVMDEVCPAVQAAGPFELQGCAFDLLSNIDPELHVYHKCRGGMQKLVLVVPAASIGNEYVLEEPIDLNQPQPNESNADEKFNTDRKCTSLFRRLARKIPALLALLGVLI